MSRRITPWAVSALLLVSAAGASWGVPPTPEQIDQAVAAFAAATKDLKPGSTQEDYQAYNKARREAAEAALKDVSIAEASADQISKLQKNNIITTAGKLEELKPRLVELSKDRGPDGARAAVMRLNFMPSAWVADVKEGLTGEEFAKAQKQHEEALARAEKAKVEQKELFTAAADHPGLPAAVKMGEGTGIFTAVSRLDASVVAQIAPSILRLESLISNDLPATGARSLISLVEAMLENSAAFDATARDRVRTRVAGVLEHHLDAAPADDAAARKSLGRSLDYVNGAFARGELMDHACPELNVLWTNSATPITTMADLKGKVVVLDFWATWCGPCIGSFPNVRKLAAHYEGYPVAVVGITSPQGYHMDRPDGVQGKATRIDCKDDPAKEMALMPEFIKQLDITWTVAFTQQDVFNPDFGVRGIPHVAILDPNGVVRYRGMHPGQDLGEKIHKINGLLKEANLPAPADLEPETKSGG